MTHRATSVAGEGRTEPRTISPHASGTGLGRERRAPFRGVYVAGVLCEQPVVAVEVRGSVLPLAILRDVQFFDDFHADGFCAVIMRVQVVNEDRQALRPGAEKRGSRSALAHSTDHHPGLAEMHLRALRLAGRPVAVVLHEPESLAEPSSRLANIS